MKDKFISFCTWAQANWLALVIFLTLAWTGFLFVIGASWLYGYWSNGLGGTKFEINSCWQGITVVGVALGAILGMAKAGWTKYRTDSELNSDLGQRPNA